jgi:hypothetical protein
MELSKENVEKIREFCKHCFRELGLKGKVKIILSRKPTGMPTAGFFIPEECVVGVACHNRAMADVMRTIAHELTHCKQHLDGVVFPEDDEGLQPYENQANEKSGFLVRHWGRAHRDIYADLCSESFRRNRSRLTEVLFPHNDNIVSIIL